MSYGLMAEPTCMFVAAGIWAGYCFIYTPLKRITIHNTGIGAIVGALPPLIGAQAQLGTIWSPEAWLLSTYIFAWQYPHFYGILYENKYDYKRAGYEMLSNYDEDGKRATGHILLGKMLSTSVPAVMTYIGMLHPIALIMYYFYHIKSLQTVFEFKKDASIKNAKKIKTESYKPFFILLSGIYATMIYKWVRQRL